MWEKTFVVFTDFPQTAKVALTNIITVILCANVYARMFSFLSKAKPQ